MDTKIQCYLNGDFVPLAQASVSVLDRGFLFGDGVYEVVPIYGGKYFCWTRHMQRLSRSLSEIGLAFNVDSLLTAAEQLLRESESADMQEGMIYMQITRGASSSRKHVFPNPAPSPTVFMMLSARPSAQQKQQSGVACKTMREIRWLRAHIKSVSLLASVLAAQEAADNNVEEVIGIRDGVVSEAAACNVLLVCDGVLLSPKADNKILGGITRDVTLQLARENNIVVREEDIPESVLYQAEELMITSSSREIVPVIQLDDKPVGDGKVGDVCKTLIASYRDFVAQGRE